MASSVPAKRNTAYSFEISLYPRTATGNAVTNPTIASGDFQISKDGGAFSNTTNTPSAIGSGDVVTVALTATEMDADRVTVRARDAAGDEWNGKNIHIRTAAQTLDEMDTNIDSILVDTAEIGAAGAGLTAINLPDQTMNITGNITGNLSGSVDSVTAGVTLATNAVSAAAVAADAVTEIQNGLATASALATTDDKIDAIKLKTDNLTFTVANQVDANVQYVNDVQVTGTGAPGSEWGPA